jgi:hypothetical protein
MSILLAEMAVGPVRRVGERSLRERAADPRLSAGLRVGEQSGEAGIRPQPNDLELDQPCPDEGQLGERPLRFFQRFRFEKDDSLGAVASEKDLADATRLGEIPHCARLRLKVGCEVG